jgi:hypothetical protein
MKRILAIMLSLLTIAALFALPTNAAAPSVVTGGLVIHYDGANNTGAGQDNKTTVWKDVSGNNHDFTIEIDDYIKWTDNALHVDGALFAFPDKALEVINGTAWTVELTLGQIELFQKNADELSESLGYKPMYHVLNSAGIERFTQYQFDMVRLGIGIYGVSAIPGNKLAPVASFKCKVLQVKTLRPEDGTIGYGRHGKIAPEGTVIATIPVGYADGIDRHLSRGNGRFMINGHKVPTIGNICMDMCMLDVTGLDVKVGDTVTIFGEDPTITDLAEILGTIPYEILTSVPRRIERIIVK